MIGKKVIVAVVILATGLLFNACIVEYDFDRAPPWMAGGGPISRTNVVGEAVGWQGGRLTVTLNLVNGYIENVRIFGERETPSYTRELIQIAQRNAALLNSFDFLDGMSGATVTRNAIIAAGRDALRIAGAAVP